MNLYSTFVTINHIDSSTLPLLPGKKGYIIATGSLSAVFIMIVFAIIVCITFL